LCKLTIDKSADVWYNNGTRLRERGLMLSCSSRKGSNPLGDVPKNFLNFAPKILKKGIDKSSIVCYNKYIKGNDKGE
jgi:hypothetical protein